MFRRWDRYYGDAEIPLAVVHEAFRVMNLNPEFKVAMLTLH
jgi:hypothetical protein